MMANIRLVINTTAVWNISYFFTLRLIAVNIGISVNFEKIALCSCAKVFSILYIFLRILVFIILLRFNILVY